MAGFIEDLKEKLPKILEQVLRWVTPLEKKVMPKLTTGLLPEIPLRMSEKGLELLTQWEGFKTKRYKDSAGLWTIGVGHQLTRSERSSGKILIKGEAVRYLNGLTHQQVIDLLSQDVGPVELVVRTHTKDLTQNQFDSLVSFTFNVGNRAFEKSTLLKKVQAGAFQEVPAQFRRWVYSGGRKVKGLVNRRENEIKLWNGII